MGGRAIRAPTNPSVAISITCPKQGQRAMFLWLSRRLKEWDPPHLWRKHVPPGRGNGRKGSIPRFCQSKFFGWWGSAKYYPCLTKCTAYISHLSGWSWLRCLGKKDPQLHFLKWKVLLRKSGIQKKAKLDLSIPTQKLQFSLSTWASWPVH